MNLRERVEAALERAGMRSRSELARACGVSPSSITQMLSGEFPGTELLAKISEKTGVPYDWLRFGDPDKAPAWARSQGVAELSRAYDPTPTVQIVGAVTAGNGDLGGYDELVESVEIPAHWKIVIVHGMSAYPVFYPKQLAWVDTSRAASPATMTEAQYVDLHDNVVVVQAEVNGKRLGLLKRFNYQPESPLKFALSSLDAGRSSPYVPPDSIDVIIPVVGSWWEDPRRPRKKRYHARSVIVKLIDENT